MNFWSISENYPLLLLFFFFFLLPSVALTSHSVTPHVRNSSLTYTASFPMHVHLLNYSVYEEVRVGWKIADLISDSGLAVRYGGVKQVKAAVTFKLINHQPPLASQAIGLDEKSGHVKVIGRLDRDSICSNSELCQVRRNCTWRCQFWGIFIY